MSAAVITGAGGAIGSAVVRRLVAQAVPVLAVDRDAETLAALHEELGDLVVPHVADVTDPGDSGTTFASFVPMGRHGTADEVAAIVVWLMSPDASFVTGTAHAVDGAFTTA
jgi:NAD(P)-dependent dehydrogenase (short-subunit alcohol dehydrogenase family)